jgi:DNA-binding MarR family transcriptional regulator
MQYWQSILAVDPAISVTPLGKDRLRIEVPGSIAAEFDVVRVGTLTGPLVRDAVIGATGNSFRLVLYERASREAREQLRQAGISHVGRDGSVHLRAPGLYLDREGRAAVAAEAGWALEETDPATTRNPYAARGSRVPRWLLLHHRESFSVSDIARAVALSPPAVSRVLRALEDRALVRDDALERDDARRRQIGLTRPRAVLDEWALRWERRRIRQRCWDIGARDADEALTVFADAAADAGRPGWMVGGLAGATVFNRVVEPSDVFVWVDADELSALTARLEPEPGRPGSRGSVRVAVAPDPWVLTLAQHSEPPVADPVQLWLDCATAGERALVAAEAVAEEIGW